MKLMPLCIFILISTLQAQDNDPHAADRDALRALGSRYEQAINRFDLGSLADSVLPEASAVFMTNDELNGLPAMQQFIEGVRKEIGEGSVYEVKLRPGSTEFHGDVAIAHGESDESVTFPNGKHIFYVTRWTAVLKKVDGTWKALRLHVSLDPIDNPIITLQEGLGRRVWAGGGLVAGIVLTSAVGLIRRKRTVRT
jgi:ketosteroid isomerase-like protein